MRVKDLSEGITVRRAMGGPPDPIERFVERHDIIDKITRDCDRGAVAECVIL